MIKPAHNSQKGFFSTILAIRGLILLTFLMQCSDLKAWIYPEHREITMMAIQRLSPGYRARFDSLWAMARRGYESRLDANPANGSLGLRPATIDYAAWPAIAGDHSISSADMVRNILNTQWILEVADITARLKVGLDNSDNNSERAGHMRDADLRLLRADPAYVSRAGSNNVHFLLARPNSEITAREYFDTCFRAGTEINLTGVYKWYHASALLKIGRLANEKLTQDERMAIALSALADEAFALHFLEDAFSSGHVAGIWGNAALRKGTHDYYDENGVEVTTWSGERLVLTGDAFMRDEDAERAAITVMESLTQLLDAAVMPDPEIVFNDRQGWSIPDTFNIGVASYMPERTADPVIRQMNYTILVNTPMPGLGSGLGEFPRFRSELGPFVGISPSARTSFISGGFGDPQQTSGVIPGLEFAVHVGLGMDGVLNESGDGLIFLDLGWRLDGSSSIKIDHDPGLKAYGAILSAIPARNGAFLRFRMPFYLIPGDLILLAPILLVSSPSALNKVVATSGQGGLIPWQTGLITPLGRFQFVLGREVGVCFYGAFGKHDAFLLPEIINGEEEYVFVSMRTTQLEFPILEYRPVRTFSKRQSASLVLQLYGGVDIPGKAAVIDDPGATSPSMKPVWMGGIRLSFDWRYYYARQRYSPGH